VTAGLHQLCRDLLWVVNSPPFCRGSDVAPAAELDPADIDEADLIRFMQDRAEHRVGRYFEQLLLYWFSRVRHLEVLGNGIQLREGKRTVGEIDFLYRDEQGVLTHCEASVKFFLHYPRVDASDFPGPNATDDFERKTDRLFTRQLAVSRDRYPEVQQRHGFVKGMAFYRDDQTEALLPPRMSRDHLRGRWFRESELEQLASQGCECGVVATKPQWLAHLPTTDATSLSSLTNQLRNHFDSGRGNPIMLNLFNSATASTGEAERVFVVPDGWPTSRR